MCIVVMTMLTMPWNGRDAMKYIQGLAVDFPDLIRQLITWTTDKTIHGDDAWQLIRNEIWPRGTILKAHGRNSGESFYIGLLPNSIEKGKSYADWFLQKKNLATYFAWNQKGLGKNGQDFSRISNGLRIEGQSYAFADIPDIFTSSAKVLHLGIFKQYSENLDWHEQAGGMDFTNISMRPIQYMINGSYNKSDFNPPLMPGVGYPTLSMDYAGPSIGNFKFWFVKDAQRLIIVMNNAEQWDVAYTGLFEPYDNQEYALPAVVVGGTSGLLKTGTNVWYSSGQRTPTPVTGLQVNYQPNNWNLVHGIPPFAAVSQDLENCPASVMAMLADGRWQSFANYVQGLNAVPEHVCSGDIPSYHFLRPEPSRPVNMKHFIRPTEREVTQFSHVYEKAADKWVYKLEPIELFEADTERTNILGRLPYLYFPSGPVIRYGEITIDGKKCLMLPNGWEGRKFHIEGHAGVVYDENVDNLLAKERRIEKLSKSMNLLIRLEE